MTTIVKFLLILLLSFFSFMGLAQVSDERAIEQAATDYMESYYESDGVQMESGFHQETAKRNVERTETSQPLKKTGHSEWVSKTGPLDKKCTEKPVGPLRINVEILDIEGDLASVKTGIGQEGLHDYMHLEKTEGQWRIVNVLWGNRRAQ